MPSTVFDTSIGRCSITWNERGIARVRLPQEAGDVVKAPAKVQYAIDGIVTLLAGGSPDLSSVVLDMKSLSETERRVYELARTIPRGSTMTYGDVAKRLGDPGLARAVGLALGRNPFPIIVPCHRVLGADGKLVGFSATGGVETKRRILEIEGAIRDLFTLG